MLAKALKVKYECLNDSCQVFCKKGELIFEKAEFDALCDGTEENDTFKTPPHTCRMGFAQKFKLISVIEEGEEVEALEGAEEEQIDPANDPIRILMAEHQGVVEKLDIVAAQVRKRDIEGLWVSTSDLENDILLHSIKKEEEGLFPLIAEKLPMGKALVGIMKEDHMEFVSILHGFRCGLQDGDMLDGLVTSLLVNLRHHIKKEDEEFFPMVADSFSREEKDELLAKMRKIDENHVPLVAGNRSEKGLSPYAEDRKKRDELIASLRAVSSVGGEAMCCGEH